MVISRREFDGVVRRQRAAITAWCAWRVGAQAAPDVVQSALLSAWTQVVRFDATQGPTGLLTYLHTHCRQAVRAYLRDQERRCEYSLSDVEVIRQAEYIDARPAPPEVWERLVGTLRRQLSAVGLTPRQAQCMERFMQQCTQAEIAIELGIPQQNVCEHLRLACEKLRRMAEPDHEVAAALCEQMRSCAYYKPSAVWDREGTFAQVERRHTVRALAAAEARAQRREAAMR